MTALAGAAPLFAGVLVGGAIWFACTPTVIALAGTWVGHLRARGHVARGGLHRVADPGALARLSPLLPSFLKEARANESKERERARCLDELCELIDVVALGLAAGVSFDAALQVYCARYQTTLSGLLGDAMRSWQLGMTTRREALESVARRLEVPAFAVFVETVTESLEFGAPLAGALTSQAEAVRSARRATVQEQIEKAPVKMLVPTGTLVLPAMLLAILGPLLATLSNTGW